MPHLQADGTGHSAGARLEALAILRCATAAPSEHRLRRFRERTTVTSAALVLDEDPRATELTVVSELPRQSRLAGSFQSGLALTVIVVVQVGWLAALGYGLLIYA